MDRKTATKVSKRRRQQKEDDEVVSWVNIMLTSSSEEEEEDSSLSSQEDKEKRTNPSTSDDAVSVDPSSKRRRLGFQREDNGEEVITAAHTLIKLSHDTWPETQTQVPQNLEKENKCKECGKEFPSGRSLGGHIGRVHPKMKQSVPAKKKIHKCSECNRKFPTAQVLGRHKRYIHGIQGGGGQRVGPGNVSHARPEGREEEFDD